MVRMILGAVAGYVVWTIIWLGTTAVLAAVSPGWFGRTHAEFDAAARAGAPFATPFAMALIALLTSFVCSLAAGFAAAAIAREAKRTALALGALLLLTGLFVEISYWNYFPLWYHALFLLGLVPLARLGAHLAYREPLA